MLSSLLTSLTSLRDFFSRAFFIAAFIPALLFVFLNALILYVWSPPAHSWMQQQLIDAKGSSQIIIFAALFFFIWINAYMVSSLTPLWTRTLEGRNWWDWLRVPGARHHRRRYGELTFRINNAVEVYARIERQRSQWVSDVQNAIVGTHPAPGIVMPAPDTNTLVTALKEKQVHNELLPLDEVTSLAVTYTRQIQFQGNTDELQNLAGDIQLLIDYAIDRARSEHLRFMNQRNMDFSDQGDIAPTRFGNVALIAQAYAVRAFGCNLTRIWSALQRVSQKEENTAKALENAKSQLDFLVAGFWLSLVLAVEWALILAYFGETLPALIAAVAGPLICWLWWYGAAVEQYRVLQDSIVSCLNALRFQVIAEFRFGLPLDLLEERELWHAIDMGVGNGEPLGLRYQHPKPTS